jgi:ppGpp synthetase/RelA/SpoT-type nucleotidyltranferase
MQTVTGNWGGSSASVFDNGGQSDEIQEGDSFINTTNGEKFYIQEINEDNKKLPYYVIKSNLTDLPKVISIAEWNRFVKKGLFQKVEIEYAEIPFLTFCEKNNIKPTDLPANIKRKIKIYEDKYDVFMELEELEEDDPNDPIYDMQYELSEMNSEIVSDIRKFLTKKKKMAQGGQIPSIGDSGIITDKNSMFVGKMALIMGDLGNMFEVRVGERTTMIKKNGIRVVSDEYAKGGYTKRVSKDDLYRVREKTKHERTDTEGVGNFELPKDKDTRYLYELNDFDKNLVKDIKLKPNEHIFRYETYSTKIGGYIPLIKINLDNQMVYFLTENAWDGGDIEFGRKGEKAQFINISDKYAQGGFVGADMTPTMMGGGMGNVQDAILENGGLAKVEIVNKDVKFDKNLYKGVLDDFDLDGLPNADDPHPFSRKDKKSVEQTKLSTALNNVVRVKEKMDDELEVFVAKLQKSAPSDSKIYGRTKTPYSILNKLVNSRLLDAKRGLKDLVGTTVAFNSFSDLQKFKKQVDKGLFGKVVDFDDYYENPNDGYRAYHYIVEQDGIPIELQLKTDRMKQINVLSHDAYKNQNLNKDYLLYLTTIANEADKGNSSAMEQFTEVMGNKVAVKKRLSNQHTK